MTGKPVEVRGGKVRVGFHSNGLTAPEEECWFTLTWIVEKTARVETKTIMSLTVPEARLVAEQIQAYLTRLKNGTLLELE